MRQVPCRKSRPTCTWMKMARASQAGEWQGQRFEAGYVGRASGLVKCTAHSPGGQGAYSSFWY